MQTSRRRLIAAAGALALPGPALALEWPWRRQEKATPGCHGRAAYGGGPLHPQLDPAQFDAAAKAASARVTPYASDDLDARLEKAVGIMKVPTLTAAVARSDGSLWNQIVAGAGAPPPPDSFEWPGLGDMLTATAVLQLVEEGKLTLETPADRWAPELTTARWITVEDLLSHTGGLVDGPGLSAPYCPGAGWVQARTGYGLLGRIVEALDGRPLKDALARRVVERLELKETTLSAAPGATVPVVKASALDMVAVWRGLLGDRLHGQAITRGRFLRLYPTTAAPARTWWGLGVEAIDVVAPSTPAETWLASQGARPGFASMVAYSPRKRAFAAVALTGDGSPERAIAWLMEGVQADPTALTFTPRPPQPARKPRRAPRPRPKPAAPKSPPPRP